MRVPHVRFTVRRLMFGVAIAAVVLAVSTSLVRLYNAPHSLFAGYRSVDPGSDRLRKPASVGQLVKIRYPFVCEMASWARPGFESLAWIYNSPHSIDAAYIALKPGSDRIEEPVPVGQPVRVRYPYVCEMASWAPPGYPYMFRLEIKLIRGPTEGHGTDIVEETHRKDLVVISGKGAWGTARGELNFDLTPRRPGIYAIRYASRVSDLFGRNHMSGGTDIAVFEAR